jgi:threonine/homoserine/homoserine lactone efflux protein
MPSESIGGPGSSRGFSALLNGLATGLFLQLAVGPVFFFVMGICLASDYTTSIFAILAVTLVDFLYIALSLAGLGAILEKDRIKLIFGVVGALVLLGFGVVTILGAVFVHPASNNGDSVVWTPLSAFSGAFLLTVSSPLTIVFWTSVFATKAAEKNYVRRALVGFGLGAGSATFIFMSLAMLLISVFKAGIPGLAIRVLDVMVGVAMIMYAIMRIFRVFRQKKLH